MAATRYMLYIRVYGVFNQIYHHRVKKVQSMYLEGYYSITPLTFRNLISQPAGTLVQTLCVSYS